MLKLTEKEIETLKKYLEDSEDCEKLNDGEWVMDIYEPGPSVSIDLVFDKNGVRIDGAEYLSYDEELDGWYISGEIESGERLYEILKNAGAL